MLQSSKLKHRELKSKSLNWEEAELDSHCRAHRLLPAEGCTCALAACLRVCSPWTGSLARSGDVYFSTFTCRYRFHPLSSEVMRC